ncbi:unnamed protein product [Rotaria sordida]|uniref:Uncharacterized protein n=1 Tax=Rotaria sordida TaxID=392033 RepID=A0A815KIS2_9BILA|nr:unnamed protein product [Rotaria sordida]
METVIRFHTHIFMWCLKPMKSAIVRLFPYLCELESIVPSENLTISRMHVTMTCLHTPILESLIEQLEYLCELESIVSSENLTISRMHVTMTYLHTPFLESLIEQLEHVNTYSIKRKKKFILFFIRKKTLKVCTTSKWHTRQVAMEFIQYMVFCNLFNAGSYKKQLCELVF